MHLKNCTGLDCNSFAPCEMAFSESADPNPDCRSDCADLSDAEDRHEPETLKCTLRLLSDKVIDSAYPAKGDLHFSVGSFFNKAKTKLGVPESAINLVIGQTTLSADSQARRFFLLKDVKDAIQANVQELTIYVIKSS